MSGPAAAGAAAAAARAGAGAGAGADAGERGEAAPVAEGSAAAARSVLYRGEVVHVRHDEHARRFRYPVYVAGLDLDELPALAGATRLLSLDRVNLFSVQGRDYACTAGGARSLRDGHAAVLAAHGLPAPARVELITWLRTAHYLFNPVCFFVGRDAGGAITSVLAEVRNNYGGRHAYVLGPGERIAAARPGRTGFRVPKAFFVSPFLHGAATYDFWFRDARGRLDVHMDVRRPDGTPLLTAHLRGSPAPLTDGALAAAAVRYPLMSVQVIGLIYAEALLAHARGVPYRRPGPAHAVTDPPSPPTPAPATPPPRPLAGLRSPLAGLRPLAGLARPLAALRSPLAGLARPLAGLARPLAGFARRLVLANAGDLPPGRGVLDVRFPDSTRVTLGRGPRADATITLHDARALARILLRGELGAGEAYVAGEWDADDLPAALRLFLRATAARGVESPVTRLAALPARVRHALAGNSRRGSARNIAAHYDLGNDFYRTFLDAQLVYSCALWADAATLEDAQRAKLDRLCDLAGLAGAGGRVGPAAGGAAPHVLELGCGWGALAAHAARRGARVTGITLSPAQLAHARAATAGLPVELALRDYRDVTGTYDAILSCEMLEAVGERYLPAYFAAIAARLRRGGRAVIQSITMPDARYAAYRRSVDWMQTYVFPGSHIPSLGVIRAAAAGAGLQLVSASSIGADYAPTLAAWRHRFTAALPRVRALGFDEPFIRTWTLYLAFSEAAFAEASLDVHQLVLRHAR